MDWINILALLLNKKYLLVTLLHIQIAAKIGITHFIGTMSWESGAFAQSQTPTPSFFTTEIITIYFLMLLFATIINRLLEYLKLFVVVIDQKIGFFACIGNAIFDRVRGKMDRLGILYNPAKVRANLKKYVIFAVMQFWAFVLGIVLAWLLKMDVLAQVQIKVGQPLGFILTGLIIGAGVDPVHSFFRIAQEKRKIKKLLARLQTSSVNDE